MFSGHGQRAFVTGRCTEQSAAIISAVLVETDPCGAGFNTMSTARQAIQSIRDTPSDATKAIPVLPYGPEQSRWFIKRLQETRAHH